MQACSHTPFKNVWLRQTEAGNAQVVEKRVPTPKFLKFMLLNHLTFNQNFPGLK